MRRGGLAMPPMGGEGQVVEADETYFGNIPEAQLPKFKTTGKPFKGRTGPGHKRAIIALVERGGSVRSFHVPAAHMGNRPLAFEGSASTANCYCKYGSHCCCTATYHCRV